MRVNYLLAQQNAHDEKLQRERDLRENDRLLSE